MRIAICPLHRLALVTLSRYGLGVELGSLTFPVHVSAGGQRRRCGLTAHLRQNLRLLVWSRAFCQTCWLGEWTYWGLSHGISQCFDNWPFALLLLGDICVCVCVCVCAHEGPGKTAVWSRMNQFATSWWACRYSHLGTLHADFLAARDMYIYLYAYIYIANMLT